jgi:hypothetical protein
MNCANHPDIAAVAYCRTCGKPLCASCTRDVKGVIYCENCLADRLAGVQPTVTPTLPGVVSSAPVAPGSGPNPAVAGILAGFFPLGVGAVYTGQYAKGLAHLLIFVGLIYGMTEGGTAALICGLSFSFFYVWQIIDSVRTAHALQAGQPAPDPLGLGEAFSTGGRSDAARVPTAAVVLIGLGVLFLLQTAGVFRFGVDQVGPVLLVLLGGWLFARRSGLIPSVGASDYSRRRNFVGPAVLVAVGVLWFVDNIRGLGFFGWVGTLLLVIGIVKIVQRDGGGPSQAAGPPFGGSGSAGTSAGSEVQPPVSEVHNG